MVKQELEWVSKNVPEKLNGGFLVSECQNFVPTAPGPLPEHEGPSKTQQRVYSFSVIVVLNSAIRVCQHRGIRIRKRKHFAPCWKSGTKLIRLHMARGPGLQLCRLQTTPFPPWKSITVLGLTRPCLSD